MDGDGAALTRSDIESLLRRLGELAESSGVSINIFLVGGSAMALAYNANRTTGDLDAVFEPKSVVYPNEAEPCPAVHDALPQRRDPRRASVGM